MLEQNQNSDSLFYEKIDVQNIGIAGYSKGGVGAVRAVTECENSGLYKTIFTGSAFLSCADAGLKSIYSVVYDCRCGTCGNADKD